MIFIHAARDYYESDDGGCFTYSVPSWVNVSYVCNHWRNVALDCPTLWTFHFNVSLHWTDELLLRSQDESLKIVCVYPYRSRIDVSWGQSLLDKFITHAERIQELSLDVPLSFFPYHLSLCTPRLEKLEINRQWDKSITSIAITDGDKCPLHTLRLAFCTLPWRSLNLSGLKTLFLHDVRPSPPLSMAEFLAVLSSMKNLTVLHLDRVLPRADDLVSSRGVSASPKFKLPCLTLLTVMAPLSGVIALLSSINIPRSTRLSLGLQLEPGTTVGDIAPISSFLVQQFGHEPIFRSLFLDTRHSCFCWTFGLENDPPPDMVGYATPLRITFEVVYGKDVAEIKPPDDIYRIMCEICSSLSLGNIQHLHVYLPQLLADFWRVLLSCLDGLRHLELSYGDMPDLSLLSLPACASDENGSGQPLPDQGPTLGRVLVPALEALELYQVVFAPDHTPWSHWISHKSLLDILSTRKEPQVRLTMTECIFIGDSRSPSPASLDSQTGLPRVGSGAGNAISGSGSEPGLPSGDVQVSAAPRSPPPLVDAINSMPRTNTTTQSMSALPESFLSSEFTQSVANTLDEFDAQGLFNPEYTPIDFEKDFSHWFKDDLEMR